MNAFASAGDALFAGTDSGLFRSIDQGATWHGVRVEATNVGRVLAIAASGENVYAGTDRNGVLVSSQKVMKWSVDVGFPSSHVRCLLAHGHQIYAGTDAQGVFVLSDSGSKWARLREGLPSDAQVFALAAFEETVFAALYSKGLYLPVEWPEPALDES